MSKAEAQKQEAAESGNMAAKAIKIPVDIKALSFEKAMQELEEIVSRLERGDVPLEQSISIYERGELLKRHCEALLHSAENKIEKIRLDDEGRPEGLEPLD